jgi:aminomethyltransferase
MSRLTPFHSRTSALNESQSWQDWSGYLSANLYDLNHLYEYYAIRTSAALIDISPLYKYHIHGRDALRLLNRVATRDLSGCAVGQARYTPWCDDDGKVIDDGTIARLAEDRYRLTSADPTLRWLEENARGLQVQVEDVSAGLAALALQGPSSRDLLVRLAGDGVRALKYYELGDFNLAAGASAEVPATISRTGFTGDLGYELWVEPQHAEQLWDALMEAGQAYRLRPAGNLALDMARIEAGFLLIAVDYTSSKKTMFELQKSSPLELGLGWTVNLNGGRDYFVGKAALQREKARGPAWSTIGLEIDLASLENLYRAFDMPLQLPAAAWNSPVPIYALEGEQVGRATSGVWSPLLKKYIAIARLRTQHASPGARVMMEVTIEAQRLRAEAVVVRRAFYDPERKRR